MQELNTDGLNQEFDTERLNKEFQKMSFEMQNFVAGLVRQSTSASFTVVFMIVNVFLGSRSADDDDER